MNITTQNTTPTTQNWDFTTILPFQKCAFIFNCLNSRERIKMSSVCKSWKKFAEHPEFLKTKILSCEEEELTLLGPKRFLFNKALKIKQEIEKYVTGKLDEHDQGEYDENDYRLWRRFTYTVELHSMGSATAEEILKVQTQILLKGGDLSLNAVVSHALSNTKIDIALQTLEKIKKPDSTHYEDLILYYCDQNRLKDIPDLIAKWISAGATDPFKFMLFHQLVQKVGIQTHSELVHRCILNMKETPLFYAEQAIKISFNSDIKCNEYGADWELASAGGYACAQRFLDQFEFHLQVKHEKPSETFLDTIRLFLLTKSFRKAMEVATVWEVGTALRLEALQKVADALGAINLTEENLEAEAQKIQAEIVESEKLLPILEMQQQLRQMSDANQN